MSANNVTGKGANVRTVCAWCERDVGRAGAPNTSHTICPRHRAEMLAEYRRDAASIHDDDIGREAWAGARDDTDDHASEALDFALIDTPNGKRMDQLAYSVGVLLALGVLIGLACVGVAAWQAWRGGL